MNTRILGRTGLSVSEVGLGCEHLEGQDPAVVRAVIHRALDAGMNLLDVFMPGPDIRDHIGAALDGRRGEAVLQGHFGVSWTGGQYRRTRDPGESADHFNDLLRRLRTDRIDIGMYHFCDARSDLDAWLHGGMLDQALKLKRDGVLRAVGMSSHDPVIAREAVESGTVDVLMFSVNPAFDLLPSQSGIEDYFEKKTFEGETLSDTHPERDALYRACVAQGTAITVMKAYAGGMLLHGPASPLGARMTPVQCIQYALDRPAVASVLAGCRSVTEVDAAAAYAAAGTGERDYAEVLRASHRFSVSGHCMYCNHCLPCPVRLDIAQVLKLADLAAQADTPSVRAHYDALSAHASDCIACGQCEPRCPFGVPVVERMRQAAAVFSF